MKNNLIAPALILGLFGLICTLLVTSTWEKRQKYDQTLAVVGSATQAFKANLGVLRGTIGASGVSMVESFSALNRQKPQLLAYLKQQGFGENDVEFLPPSSSAVEKYDEHGHQTGQILRYNYYQRFSLQSDDVALIQRLSLSLAALVEKGVYLTVDSPEYIYADLAELKVTVQALAAKDALERAKKIADATNAALGPMRSARMGVLQITPLHSTQVSDYGISDTSSIDKQITAVVSASFGISPL